MNLQKHLAGLALFSVILGSAIFINHYLTIPNVTIHRAPLYQDKLLNTEEKVLDPRPVNYKVRLVSLDFINQQSYTVLVLKREAARPTPENLWVTTVFFLPGRGTAGKLLTSTAKILKPFTDGDTLEYVVTSSCDWCVAGNMPRAGYFARVFVSAGDAESPYAPDVEFDTDIERAIPVVVQSERKTQR